MITVMPSNIPTIYCRICGSAVEQPQGRGRPRELHVECKRLAHLLSWVEREIYAVEPRMSDVARKEIRSRLWVLGNMLTVNRA